MLFVLWCLNGETKSEAVTLTGTKYKQVARKTSKFKNKQCSQTALQGHLSVNYVSDRSPSCPRPAELPPVSLTNCSAGDRTPLPPEWTCSPDIRADFVTWLTLPNRFLLPVLADSSHPALPASTRLPARSSLATCGMCAPHTSLHSLRCSLTAETNVLEQKRLQKSEGVMKGQIPPPQATNCCAQAKPQGKLLEGIAVGWALINPHCRFHGHHRGGTLCLQNDIQPRHSLARQCLWNDK